MDFHVHIARLPHAEELSKELLESGYKAVIVASEPWEWEKAETLLPIWKDAGVPCFGVHPMIAQAFDRSQFSALRRLLEKYPQAFVGECGLDKRYGGYERGGIQDEIFREQAKLALEMNRPLMIHSVGDARRILEILEQLGYSENGPQPIFHRFGGDSEIVRRALKLNALFSLHPDSFRKASTKKALLQIPRERIRFETDADESFAPATAENLLKQLGLVSSREF